MKRKHIGSSLDDFLKEEGIYEDCRRESAKLLLAYRLAEQMKRQKVTKVAMAKRMHTSRSSLSRILDPRNKAVSLDTLERAAGALGKRLKIDLV